MKHTPFLFSLALLGSLSLSPLAAAETPSAQQVCTALTKSAKKQSGNQAKGRQALAAAIKKLEKAPENVNVRSKGKGMTPLMIATALGEKDAIRWLISIGADPTIKDASGKDSLARAKGDTTTALLRKGALFTWEEVLAHLESVDWPEPPTKDMRRFYEEGNNLSRSGMMAECRQLATDPNSGDKGFFLQRCMRLGDMKMTSFLYRQGGTEAYDGSIVFSVVAESLTGSKRIAMLNLLAAHGYTWNIQPNDVDATLMADSKFAEWLSEHMIPQHALLVAVRTASQPLFQTNLERYKETAGEQNAQKAIANAIGVAISSKQEKMLPFLLKHDRGGRGSLSAVYGAIRNNRVDLLKQLVDEDAPETLYDSHDDIDWPLMYGMWHAFGAVTHQETFDYMKNKLKGKAPAVESEEDRRYGTLSRALASCVMADARDVHEGEPANPVRLKVAKFLLEHGADPVGPYTTSTLDEAKTDAMKKLLQTAVEKKQGM